LEEKIAIKTPVEGTTLNLHKPKITVLLPVYNAEKYLTEAIESILQQTFSDFELLVVEGGSKDNSLKIIRGYDDPRIRVIFQDKDKLGLSAALNQGLENAKGKYIARMDCDDICFPTRFQKQVEFMDNNPDIAISGTWIKIIGIKPEKIVEYPTTHDEIRALLFFLPPLAHPTVIMRRAIVNEKKLRYNPDFIIGEDFDLWSRSSFKVKMGNLPEVLLYYRAHSENLSLVHRNKHSGLFYSIYKRHLDLLDIPFVIDDYDFVRSVITSNIENFELTWSYFEKANHWLHLVEKKNKEKNVYIEPYFSEQLADKWFRVCYKFRKFGRDAFRVYNKSVLRRYSKISLKLRIRFFLLVAFHQIFTRKKGQENEK